MENGIRTLTATDLNTTTSTKQEQYGAIGQTADGRLYRYCGVGASQIANGLLAVVPSPVANHTNQSVATTSPTAVGSTQVNVAIGNTAATQDQYAEGYLVVNSGTGAGYSYKIKGNSAAAGNGTVTVYLQEPLLATIANSSSTKVSLVASPWSSLVTSTTASRPVGVAATTIPASNYGWFQTYGPCSVQSDASVASKAQAIKQSVTTAGDVTVAAAATDATIGSAVEAGVSAEYRLVWLSID